MAGLSSGLLADLRKTLSECGPFYSDDHLRTVFVDDRLKPWRNSLPNANNNAARVDAVISYLSDRRNRDGQSALWLMVKVLQERTDPDDACHDQLDALARRLEKALLQPAVTDVPTLTHSQPASSAPSSPVDMVRLHQQLAQYFALEELRTLCFGLGVDFDDLPGEGKGAKARELVTFMERRGRIQDLITLARKERPHVSW